MTTTRGITRTTSGSSRARPERRVKRSAQNQRNGSSSGLTRTSSLYYDYELLSRIHPGEARGVKFSRILHVLALTMALCVTSICLTERRVCFSVTE